MTQANFISITILLFCVFSFATAATITWTGGAGNSLWNFAGNWQGNTVPTANDNVVINALGGAAITISQPAYAYSITIGGVSYAQSLTLLSSLSVGAGGITVASRGTLQLSGNNDLPLSSVGNVTAQAGGSIIFNSGEILGPGKYVVAYGASLVFSGSALKLIQSTSLYLNGVATIQPTAIQLANGSTIQNRGDLTAVGLINIFSNDNSATGFYNYANFSYQGGNTASPLTFDLPTYFADDLDIKSGAVILNDVFHSTATVNLPQGTSITVNSGPKEKVFGSVIGAGSFYTQGLAEFTGALSVTWVTISDSGSLVLSTNSTTKTLGISGSLVLNAKVVFVAAQVTLTAGTITGSGELIAVGTFEVAASTNGNTNSFIATLVTVGGAGYTTGAVYILFSAFGTINIITGATFKVAASAHLLKQSGSPVFINNGVFTISLNSGSVFYSNVDQKGSGTLNVVSGLVTFEADSLTTGIINTGADALITISTAIVNASSVTGVGSLNITAAPTPYSIFGDVSVAYFGLPNGNVQVKSLTADTLELWNGQLFVSSGSNNKATIFNFYGGALRGKARLLSAKLLVYGEVPQTIDGVIISASQFDLRAAGSESTLISENNAQIIVGSQF